MFTYSLTLKVLVLGDTDDNWRYQNYRDTFVDTTRGETL